MAYNHFMETRRYVVTGRVQGVGFRFYTRSMARRLGVRGWVRNRPDGSVEVLARAEKERLSGFAALLREGPPGAAVDHLDEETLPGGDPLPDFHVRF